MRYTVDGHCVLIDGDPERLVCDCSDEDFGKSRELAELEAQLIADLLNEKMGGRVFNEKEEG